MKTFLALTKRNIKVFFKDKGMFFTSLITPVILLVLYVTFLAKVYRNTFVAALPDGVSVPEKLISGMVAGELVSSLLAVCCVTVAFCSNTLMVNDRITGARQDLLVSPAKRSVIAASYFSGTFFTTLIVTYAATAAGLIYVAASGWYMSFRDVVLIIVDVFLLTAFGTALSSVVNALLRTQGAGCGHRYDSIGGLRFYLRRVYADIEFRERSAKLYYAASRHIRHFTFKKSFVKRRLRRDGKARLPEKSNRRG